MTVRALPEASGLVPVDKLLLCALAVLAALTGTFYPNPLPLLLVHGALALFVWTTAQLGNRSRAGDLIHAFAPMVVVIGVFETVGYVVGVTNPARWDSYFFQLDQQLFGQLVPAWRGALGRPAWLSDILSAFYFSYYVVPLMMGLAIYFRNRREDFDRFVFGLQVTLLLSYAGYFVFPTAGPRLTLEEARIQLGGGAISEAVRLFINRCEFNAYDAFPSGHTAASLVFLAYGWRMLPRWRIPLAITTGSIIFSTVYLSHHYIIDLFAGTAVAVLALAMAPVLQRVLGFTASEWIRDEESLVAWFTRVFTAKRDG